MVQQQIQAYFHIQEHTTDKSFLPKRTHRDAKVSPGRVTTGVPVHRMSILVVCPLQSGVSRHTSANCPRRTCSSLAATFENIIRPGGRPLVKIYAIRLK